jgi:hypothetical protein
MSLRIGNTLGASKITDAAEPLWLVNPSYLGG